AGGLSYDKIFTIGVTNVNEAPTDVALAGNTVAENSTAGTVVGSLTSTDPDAASTATYSLVDNAGGRFAISGTNLVVASGLDYETNTSHPTRRSADHAGGLSYDKIFTIGVTNVNEAPTDIVLAGSTVAENSAAGTVVGALTSTDPDAGST